MTPASLQLRDDVYGRDSAILALLKGSDANVADIQDRAARDQHEASGGAVASAAARWIVPASRSPRAGRRTLQDGPGGFFGLFFR